LLQISSIFNGICFKSLAIFFTNELEVGSSTSLFFLLHILTHSISNHHSEIIRLPCIDQKIVNPLNIFLS